MEPFFFGFLSCQQINFKTSNCVNFSLFVPGKLGIYDADGDGDFDVEDAKVLLGK